LFGTQTATLVTQALIKKDIEAPGISLRREDGKQFSKTSVCMKCAPIPSLPRDMVGIGEVCCPSSLSWF